MEQQESHDAEFEREELIREELIRLRVQSYEEVRKYLTDALASSVDELTLDSGFMDAFIECALDDCFLSDTEAETLLGLLRKLYFRLEGKAPKDAYWVFKRYQDVFRHCQLGYDAAMALLEQSRQPVQ
jgi:hypothetical protein